jgi:hypothetical protein
MPEFKKFAKLINDQFVAMQTDELYVVDLGEIDIFATYLEAFPEGTNPIYRVRTEHDGSIDKHFIRRIGNVVAIQNGQIVTVWDSVFKAEHPYDVVSRRMSELIKSLPIKNVFRTRENSYGNEETIELLEGNQTKKWFHLHTGEIDRRYRTQDVEAELGKFTGVAQVFRRGLEELSLSAMNDVRDLIDQNALYRGEEHLTALKRFISLKTMFDQPELTAQERDLFVWSNIGDRNARFRNTVIGTLVQDLSEGVDLERAVKGFETKVAPTNYKRPTALITPRMVEDAMTTIRDLDLEPALERRFAQLSDVSVNNVLFVDNSVQNGMKGGVQDLLMSEAKRTPARDMKATEIGIDDFMSNILPGSSTIDVSLKNGHAGNFMSLTAPARDTVQPLFKWSNNFAWSYDGNITDSIREKVKRAGGNVDATLRVSLAWFNSDDLDIHVLEPSGNVINFSNKDGKLDVDMNAGGPSSREPVENVQWTGRVPDGRYTVNVHNYSKRESVDVGFVLEVEFDGNIQTFSYDKAVKNQESVKSLELTVKNGMLQTVTICTSGVINGSSSIEKWGVHTEQFVPVNTIMFSPNHWDDNATGNKHWFFILKDCVNPDRTRGIYNEFLKPELEQHRKVFEILGDKTKCETTDDQLSGVGFSSTKREKLTVLADGRPYEIQF